MCHDEHPGPDPRPARGPVCVEIHVHLYAPCDHGGGGHPGHDHARMYYSDMITKPYPWQRLLKRKPGAPPPSKDLQDVAIKPEKPAHHPAAGGAPPADDRSEPQQ